MRRCSINLVGLLLGLLVLAGCGGAPAASLATLPAFPGATELQEGESSVGDTLAQNNQTDAALRQQLGVGGATEQKGYRLPQETTWEAVKQFYDERLKADGWEVSPASAMLEQANQSNELFRTANWLRGSQSVTVVMVTSPVDPSQKELIISLSSQ